MIEVMNQHPILRVNKQRIARAVRITIQTESKQIDAIQVFLVTDAKIKQIHKSYLNDSSVTDVITFDLSINSMRISGDIFVSLDTAKRQAEEYGVSLLNEVSRLVAHGALHLCGYDDLNVKMKTRMTSKENEVLKQLYQ